MTQSPLEPCAAWANAQELLTAARPSIIAPTLVRPRINIHVPAIPQTALRILEYPHSPMRRRCPRRIREGH